MNIPFSIKTRMGIDEDDISAQMNFLIEISPYVEMITIHGRTVKQGYSGVADRNFAYQLKEQLKDTSCKVLGNGSIGNYEDIARLQGNLD